MCVQSKAIPTNENAVLEVHQVLLDTLVACGHITGMQGLVEQRCPSQQRLVAKDGAIRSLPKSRTDHSRHQQQPDPLPSILTVNNDLSLNEAK